MHFANIMCIISNSGAGEYCAFSRLHGEKHSVVELVALSKTTDLTAYKYQPMHLLMLVSWFSDPLGIRISSESFMD